MDKHDNEKSHIGFKILLWIIFLPLMLIISIIDNKHLKGSTKAIIIGILLVIAVLIPDTDTENKEETVISDNSSVSDTHYDDSSINTVPDKSDSSNLDILNDDILKKDFYNACNLIGMNPNKIKNFNQVIDWIGGPRYSFTYLNTAFRLYCNSDSTVDSIKLGVDIDVYKKGYEPYPVSDYLVNSTVANEIQNLSESAVKEQLNFPSTADFSWLGWSFFRDKDIYWVSSEVEAENAFGVKEKIPFKLAYQISGDSATLLYFMMGSNIIIDQMDTISRDERKPINSTENTADVENDTIILRYGELGHYGKEITLDGYTSINYYVPSGIYTIESQVNSCTVFISDNEYYKNIDGYMENNIIESLKFNDIGESKTIEIPDNAHIELTLHAVVSLSSKNN